MTSTDWILLAVAVVLFLISIVLAVAETAFVRMSRIRAMALEEDGRRGAARLVTMLEHPEQTLNVVLLVVLITQLTTATLVGVLLERSFGALGVVVGIFVQISAFFVLGEVAPKTYAVQHTDKAALRVSGLLWALTRFPPLHFGSAIFIKLANLVLPGKGLREGPFTSEEEILTMADVAADELVIEREERQLIHSIFEFGDTLVREVMVPRTDMIAVEADGSIDEALDTAIEHGFSRLPVFSENRDNIIGLVYLKDMVAARAGDEAVGVRSVMRQATFVPEQKRVAELLREMQTDQFHMAVVLDEYGGTSGIVTLEDLLEEIVGEIVDEYDVEEPRVERLDDATIRVAGATHVDEVAEELGVDLPDDEWDSVGGLVLNLLGHVPVAGESVSLRGLTFSVERVQRRRIVRVLIRRTEPMAESNEAREAPAGADGDSSG
ncbi:MAG: hemolysin family protein [Acidimicrobiia bacterium]|nr:hemolysin family protein [Acidimicrobiia bacterium]